MPNTETQADLFAQFQHWLHSPDAALRREFPAVVNRVSTEAIIEEAMWAAYRAGYAQAAKDCDGALRLVELLKVPRT